MSEPLAPRRQSRSRGANGWTLRVYDALWENRGGLTRAELLAECVERFPRSGTMEWFRQVLGDRESILVDNATYGLESEFRDVVALKMRSTVNGMRKRREIRNLGTTRNPRYAVMDPPKHPKYWEYRTIRPGGFREYIPTEQRAIGSRHALAMRWPSEARAELARPRPRNAELIRLLGDALTLLDTEGGA